ncbi:MAG: 3-phosphoshikimate 1-carboxyvinyltransferase [Candidatus Latescibacteria bacterium]|nr:3-phosphoshikimate 1-carboxyvinyltransferase [Candidatus Latescibacterota bacterium]
MSYRIRPAKKFRGRWQAAGDKSLTHRAFLFNALGEGEAVLRGLNAGEDCARSRVLVEALGARVEPVEGEKGAWRITGRGGRFRAPDGTLDAGNSGTTLRLACGLLAAQAFASTLDGDDTLRRRPMARIQAPLAALGATVTLTNGGTAPVTVQGGALAGCDYVSPVASAQVKSAFLLAALQAEGASSFREPVLSRDHSERLLRRMGAEIVTDGDGRLRLSGPQSLRCVSLDVPGDISSAAFLIAAGVLVEGGNVLIKNLGVNPTRTGFLDVLERMGGRFALYHPREEAGEPVADLLAQHSALEAVEVAPDEVPRLVDEIPILAVLAARAQGKSRFHGLGELRVKESDRLAQTASLLEAFGAKARVVDDTLEVEGGARLKGAEVDAAGDHRIAMAASVLGLLCRGDSRVNGTACVATSFPEFPGLLRRFSDGALAQDGDG